jgi:hypothetical protein
VFNTATLSPVKPVLSFSTTAAVTTPLYSTGFTPPDVVRPLSANVLSMQSLMWSLSASTHTVGSVVLLDALDDDVVGAGIDVIGATVIGATVVGAGVVGAGGGVAVVVVVVVVVVGGSVVIN